MLSSATSAAEANPKQSLQSCDLCGSTEALHLAGAFGHYRGQLVVCSKCGLIYASPQESEASLDSFNEEIFDGDAGTRVRVGSCLPDPEEILFQQNLSDWGIKFVRRNIEIKDKKILDVRCQSGALSSALKAEGAEVFSIDPFEANVKYCKQKRGLSNVCRLSFSRFSDLTIPVNGQFDAVTTLMDHVLSHLLSPRKFLCRIFELLKPGGYLFMLEKDVLSPSWSPQYKILFVLNSGRSHQHHLTLHTAARYLQTAGFELLECEIDNERMSALRQIRIVARKPQNGSAAVEISRMIDNAPRAEAIQRRIRWLKVVWHFHNARRAVNHKLKRGRRFVQRIAYLSGAISLGRGLGLFRILLAIHNECL